MHAGLYEYANTHTLVVVMTWMKLLIQSKHSQTVCVCVCGHLHQHKASLEEVLWSAKGVTLLLFLSLPNLHFLLKYSPASTQLSDSPSLSPLLSLCSPLTLSLLSFLSCPGPSLLCTRMNGAKFRVSDMIQKYRSAVHFKRIFWSGDCMRYLSQCITYSRQFGKTGSCTCTDTQQRTAVDGQQQNVF